MLRIPVTFSDATGATPTAAFAEGRNIVDNKVEEPKKRIS
jgi:hypothetical protein